jgi:hypothetical protein
MSTDEVFKLPEKLAGQFTIMECLAEKERGNTYRLLEKDSGKKFTLKSYPKTNAPVENREGMLLRDLKHKGIPQYESDFNDGDTYYVLREYIEGVSLGQYLLSKKEMTAAQAINIVIELCDILTYLHTQSPPVIHRDINPSNIIINQNNGNEVKLIDFGISRLYIENSKSDTENFGTREYSAPEQYGFAQTDSRTDLFSLGVVLRFMLTGKTDGIIKDSNLARIVNKSTAFDPENRYQSADAFKKALKQYKNRSKVKAALAACTMIILCGVFAAGMAVGRYTDFLKSPTVITGEEAYTFVEPLIEEAVKLMLDIPDGQAVTYSNLDDVTELYIIGNVAVRTPEEMFEIRQGITGFYGTISQLDDLSKMKNLRVINFSGQAITDITPLANCSMLMSIDLVYCPLANISPLTSLTQLQQMNLRDTNVRDFSPLDEIPSLRRLWLAKEMEQYLDTMSRDDIEVFF